MPAQAGPQSPGAVSPNVLNRQFDAPAPNRKWVADFTYLWAAKGWLYIAAVVDLFPRRVAGWSMQATMTALGHRCIGHGDLAITSSAFISPYGGSTLGYLSPMEFERQVEGA